MGLTPKAANAAWAVRQWLTTEHGAALRNMSQDAIAERIMAAFSDVTNGHGPAEYICPTCGSSDEAHDDTCPRAILLQSGT